MDYLKLNSALRSYKMPLFTLGEIKNLFPNVKAKAIKNNFIRWVDKGYFLRLKRNLYELVDNDTNKNIPDFYVANRLYEPSYISLETALSFYSIIPDIAAAVTSVTTRPTRAFKNKYGSFFYKTCKNNAFSGYRLILYEGFKVCIADKEKALVDFLYYHLRSGRPLVFVEERFNKNILRQIDWKKTSRYAGFFSDKTVKVLKELKEYIKC